MKWESCQKERMPLGSCGKGLAVGGRGAVPSTEQGHTTVTASIRNHFSFQNMSVSEKETKMAP